MQNGSLRKRGNRYYAIIMTEDAFGNKKQREFSTHTDNKKAAQKFLNELLIDYERIGISSEKMKFGAYIDSFLRKAKPDLSPTSYRDYRLILADHVKPILGNIYLDKLKASHLEEYYALKRETLSSNTVNKHHRVINKALADAKRLGLIVVNPAENAKPPKTEPPSVGEALTPENAAKLFQTVRGSEFELPCLLAALCGLRRGEICGLRWKDIDFEKHTLTVNQTLVKVGGEYCTKPPKSKTSIRTITVPELVLAALRRQKTQNAANKLRYGTDYLGNDLVLCNELGEHINPDWLTRTFDIYLKMAGLQHIRFHDLRHTNATLMLVSGTPLKVASERLGHSTIKITADLYTHVTTSLDQKASAGLDKLFAVGN